MTDYNPRENFRLTVCIKCMEYEKDRCKDNELVRCNLYSEKLEEQNKQMLEMLEKYRKRSYSACYDYCGLNNLTARCDICGLGEHRIKCNEFIESITGKKPEEL